MKFCTGFIRGGSIKQYNVEFHNYLCCSPNIMPTGVTKPESAIYRACSTFGDMRNAYVFVRTSERERPLGRPRRRWEDTVTYLVTRHGVWIGNWIYLTLITRSYK
jgi:hypothetical protein